jgi:hypothetical protein
MRSVAPRDVGYGFGLDFSGREGSGSPNLGDS